MRVLIGIPAYNEEMTVAHVIDATHRALPMHDVAVVNDGSRDRTAAIVRSKGPIVRLIDLPCNLGYSNAVETLLRYAEKHDYDALILLDADGQHDPAMLPDVLAAFEQCGCDMLIGSRYIRGQNYVGVPIGRQLGIVLFSTMTGLLARKRIYDTTSGMKVIGRKARKILLNWQFLDFHAEAIIYLLWLGASIEEYPILVKEREHGISMYSFFSHIWYPLTVILLILISSIHFLLTKERSQ
jgi:glycosyltransferase involved in cell wall biosynthesis